MSAGPGVPFSSRPRTTARTGASSSWRSTAGVRHHRSATLNLIGSLAFGVSAIAAYVVPDTDELLNASLATSTTLLGALCFLWAARILVKPPPWLRGAPEPA